MRGKCKRAFHLIKSHRMSLLILALFVLLAIAVRMQELSSSAAFEGVVEREDGSGSTQSRRFRFHLAEGDVAEEIGEQELSLDVAPLQPEREEAFALLEEAVAAWEDSYLGENPSAEEVRGDLALPDTLCDDRVEVSYESSDYGVLGVDGSVETDVLSAEGELVELTARFSCGTYTRIETRGLLVLPPAEGSADWILRELEQEALQAEADSRRQRSFSLPDVVGGYRVVWEQGESSMWILLLFLGGTAAFCLEWRGRQAERERQKKRSARLAAEYPQMVDQFAVLLESGMTIRRAWERILVGGSHPASAGKRAKKVNPQESAVYLEEMWITYREIREGLGEREAYERFGNRIGLMPYKHFSSILTQNLTKGTRDVKELLQKESEEALEMRKSRARKLGEEAGTKMLFPMLVMLMLILLILLMPALRSL